MATSVYFGPGGRREDLGHKVYLRQLWSEDWVEYTDLHCTDAQWTCSPTIATASLVRSYGVVKSYSSHAYAQAAKLSVQRWYVKIEFTTEYGDDALVGTEDDSVVTWYGIISDVEDQQAGFVDFGTVKQPSGQQVFRCYGLEQLLNQSEIASSWYIDEAAGVEKETPHPVTFNKNGVGNRVSDVVLPANLIPVFDGTATDYGYNDNYWSTQDIVKYLLHWKGPTSSTLSYVRDVPFELSNADRLDTSDYPTVQQEGATPLAVLNRLIDRRRMRSFYFTVNETTTPHTVQLVPFTFLAEELDFDLADVDNIPANDTQKAIIADEDELTTIAVRAVDVQKVERVIARGARRSTTCTMFYFADRFEEAWSSTEESSYESAASGEAGYATWDTQKQQTRNQEVRAHEALRKVYSWFAIPDDWAGATGLYSSGTVTYECFRDDDDEGVEQYIKSVAVLPYVPLSEGIDYSGTNISDGSVDTPSQWDYRRPFVVFKRPTDGRWVIGEKMSQLAEGESDPTTDGTNVRWSAYVRTQPDSRTVEIHVTGEPQHVIAETDFTALTADRDIGDYDYKDREMLVTLTLEENRYAEGDYPVAGIPDSSLIDAQRSMVIWAGDEYRKDYVNTGTVVDVDDSGDPKTVTPGGYVRDDTQRLEVVARVAAEWYTQDRAVLTLATRRLTSDVAVGDLITTSGDATISGNTHLTTINSPITAIRIRNPRLTDGTNETPTMTITTSAGELDATTLVPPPPRRSRRMWGTR